MKNRFVKIISLSSLTLILASCASSPVAYNREKKEGSWQARVQVRDTKTNKSEVLGLEVLSVKNEALRLELTGTLGVRVASLLMKDKNIAYAIHTQKKYYSGNISDKSLQPLLKVQLDPHWLFNVFFDEPLQGNGWSCSRDSGGFLEKCDQAETKYEIIWSERSGENKRVVIKGKDFEINIITKGFATKVEHPDKAFTLEAPATYKRYKLL